MLPPLAELRCLGFSVKTQQLITGMTFEQGTLTEREGSVQLTSLY